MPKSSAWVDCYRRISPATFFGHPTDICLLLVLLYHIRLYVSTPFFKTFCNLDSDRPTWAFKSFSQLLSASITLSYTRYKSEYCTILHKTFYISCTSRTIAHFFILHYIERIFQKYRSKNHGKY